MELTLKSRETIEMWRRCAYIIARGLDAGMHRTQASEGELNLVRGASEEMRNLVIDLVRQLERGPQRSTGYGADILQLGVKLLGHPPKTTRTVDELMSIASFLNSIAQDDRTQDAGEQETRRFVEDLHEFLYREVLRGNLPEPRATSLAPAHG